MPTVLIYWLCLHIGFWAAFFWDVLIVYLILGFRHYSNYFGLIQLSLNIERRSRRLDGAV